MKFSSPYSGSFSSKLLPSAFVGVLGIVILFIVAAVSISIITKERKQLICKKSVLCEQFKSLLNATHTDSRRKSGQHEQKSVVKRAYFSNTDIL